MSKRFTKRTINWTELEKRVPDEQKAKYLAFKAKSDAYWQRVQGNPPKPPKINWEEYSKIVPVPGLVEKFKEGYSSLKVPYPKDKLSATIDEQWKSLQPSIKEYCAEMQKGIDVATKELARINALPKFDDITMEMVYDLYPGQALDPVNNPTFWPHNPEEQLGYVSPEQKALKEKGKH